MSISIFNRIAKMKEAREYVAEHIMLVSYYQMDYSDFERLVNSYFGVEDFNFVESGSRRNDTSYTFNVKRSDATVYPLEDEWWYEHSATYTALGHLCADGVIPEGTYLIDVCW